MKITILLLPAVLLLGTPATAQEEEAESEWAALDRELQSLETLAVERPPGPLLWGYLRTNLAFSNHQITDGGSTGDYGGFNIDNLRLNVTGETGNYAYRITGEAFSGTFQIEDAWARTTLGDDFGFMLGRFRPPFLRSAWIEARDLLFITRTRNGFFYAQRDLGAMFNGDHGRLHWGAALQNGVDGKNERFLQTLKAEVNLIGAPPLEWEGAYHSGSTTRLTLGGAISNEDARGASGEGTAFALESYFVSKGFSLTAEWLSYENAYDGSFPGEQRGDTQPWTITASYMVVPEKYEVALRLDYFDDKSAPLDYDRQTWTFGVNRYIKGHNLKWQLNYADEVRNGTDDNPHEKWIALGLTLAF